MPTDTVKALRFVLNASVCRIDPQAFRFAFPGVQAQGMRDKVQSLQALRAAPQAAAEAADADVDAVAAADGEDTNGSQQLQGFSAFLKGYQRSNKRSRTDAAPPRSSDGATNGASTAGEGDAVPVKKSARVANRKRNEQNGSASAGMRNGSSSNKAAAHGARDSSGAGSKALAAYKVAVCEVVKAELSAALKRRSINNEQFRSIAKRATDKVVSTQQVRISEHRSSAMLGDCHADVSAPVFRLLQAILVLM